MSNSINLKLVVWRQDSGKDEGEFHEYLLDDINVDMSFLEMLDVLNEK